MYNKIMFILVIVICVMSNKLLVTYNSYHFKNIIIRFAEDRIEHPRLTSMLAAVDKHLIFQLRNAGFLLNNHVFTPINNYHIYTIIPRQEICDENLYNTHHIVTTITFFVKKGAGLVLIFKENYVIFLSGHKFNVLYLRMIIINSKVFQFSS